jgi:hypothetical protein
MRAMMLALGLCGLSVSAVAADWKPVAVSSTGDTISIDAESLFGPPDNPAAWVRFDFPKADRRGAVRAEAQIEADCTLGLLRAIDGGEYRPNGTATVRSTMHPGNWEDVTARPSGKAILDALCWTG